MACGSCHGLSPATGKHPSVWDDHASLRCTNCHGATSNTSGSAIVDKTKHVNGSVEVKLTGGGTWDPLTKSCNVSCHEEVVYW